MSSVSSSSACHRFLAIPELVAELARCLNNKSLHRLMLTSRTLSLLCEPSLYRCVVLNSLDRRSFERIASRDYLAALARNVQHVKSLDSGLLFVVYQFHSTLAFQQQERGKAREREREQEQEQGKTANSRASLSALGLLPTPEWTPLPDILSPQMELILFPPMCNLTHFKMNFDRLIHHRLHSTYLPSYDSTSRSLLQATWLLHQSPHLVEVDMNHVGLETFRDIQTLPSVIFGLDKLRKLRLRFSLPRSEWGFLGSTLFFSCPPSLRHLRIEMFSTNRSLTDPGVLALSPPPPRRQEPLLELKSFFVQEVLTTSTQEFLSHFRHCPAVEELHIPKIDTGLDIPTITHFIGSHCQRLQSIAQDSYQPGQALPLSLGILETMAPQTLQSVNCIQCFERGLAQNDFSGLFHRHSATLRSIKLSPCWRIKSNTLRTILCECRSLETFVMIQADSPSYCGIDLVDAVAAPWVCTNLVQFFLVVNLRDCQQPSPSSEAAAAATETSAIERWDDINNRGEDEVTTTGVLKPYYEQEGPIIFTAEEKEQFRLLEMFYRQLGQLTQLEYISLKAQLDTDEVDGVNEDDQWLRYQRNSMPGMLSLGDPETGRPGFLHLFSGWKRLKSLFGSVALDAPETRRTVRLKEIKYMLTQWPALSRAEFMQGEDQEVEESADGPSALEWLREERPDIEIVLQ